jgi:hypothetical protein
MMIRTNRSKKHLEADDFNRPGVHLVTNSYLIIGDETLWWQISVGSGSLLAGKLHAFGWVLWRIHNLIQTKIGNLGIPKLINQIISTLEIVVNDSSVEFHPTKVDSSIVVQSKFEAK